MAAGIADGAGPHPILAWLPPTAAQVVLPLEVVVVFSVVVAVVVLEAVATSVLAVVAK